MIYAHNDWGLALHYLDQYDEAVSQYSKAIVDTNPKRYKAYTNWGWTLYVQGQYEEAAFKYNMAINLNPEYGIAHLYHGLVVYHQEEDISNAMPFFDKAIELLRGDVTVKDRILKVYNREMTQTQRQLAREQDQKRREAIKYKFDGLKMVLNQVKN